MKTSQQETVRILRIDSDTDVLLRIGYCDDIFNQLVNVVPEHLLLIWTILTSSPRYLHCQICFYHPGGK